MTIRPFRESGAQSSRSSRLGPDCMKPGDASTTQGGPSAILRSHPRVPDTFVIYLTRERQQEFKTVEQRTYLNTKGLSRFANRVRMLEFMVWMYVWYTAMHFLARLDA